MTENDVKLLGFELDYSYPHDQFHTNRYKKGVLEVEFTYEDDQLRTVDLHIDEVESMDVNLDLITKLTPILGHIKSDQ